MPELPEVETVRRTLDKLVTGKKDPACKGRLAQISVKNPVSTSSSRMHLMGQTIHEHWIEEGILVFQLDDYALVSHLRMEGNYRLQNRDEPTDKHIHVVFEFCRWDGIKVS